MLTQLFLQIEKCDPTLDGVLGALSNFEDEDFNGNNGKEYLWENAKGFKSNKEYVIDLLYRHYKNSDIKDINILHSLCTQYFYYLFSDYNYYIDYKFKVDNEQDNEVVITCCFITI